MMSDNFVKRIGVMQGRFSPIRNGRIQSFPWENWRTEFRLASELNISKIEWTIDSEDFYKNPLVVKKAWNQINNIRSEFCLTIPSVTCDYFMENPPWLNDPKQIFDDVILILEGMAKIESSILVIPLVDNASIIQDQRKSELFEFLQNLEPQLVMYKIRIAFETDLDPQDNKKFIAEFSSDTFGVNYDIGNSAAMGYKAQEEFDLYGSRIINVHVKDRKLGGSTVPLASGSADFDGVFSGLAKIDYRGNYILQTARASDGNHIGAIVTYKNQLLHWLGDSH